MLAAIWTKATRDRWRAMAIAVVSLAALLLMAMGVYQDIDLSFYTGLPEAFRSLLNVPADADAAGLAIGVLYGLYGALTLAALALAMGAASVAGEERDGTIGLLLGNPRSRTHVLASKAASMVLLTGLGALALYGAAYLVAVVLDVRLTGMAVGAYTLHLWSNALFYGFLAMAIGAWTGKRGLASGISAGVMVLSYLAVGIFPLIRGWEDAAKAFPWYYFDSSKPLVNGLDGAHLVVLLAGSVLLAAAAVIGLNRRDLRGPTTGMSLLDRLRTHPLTRRVAERLAGSARVSRIWVKAASDHQGLLIVTGYVMFLIMGVVMGALYSLMDQTMLGFADQIPDAVFAFAGAGGGNMSTPEGFFEVETFGLMAPIAVMVVAVVIGAGALAGEEQRRTMGLLLANPVRRSGIVLEKAVAMTLNALAVGVATFAGVWLGSVIGGLDMNVGNIAATCLLVTLVGLAFGALALAISAATGRVKVAVFGAVGAAVAFHMVTSLDTLNGGVGGLARWSPFHYYLTSDPLNNGMNWSHATVLAGLVAILLGLAVVLFDRRDLRQTG